MRVTNKACQSVIFFLDSKLLSRKNRRTYSSSTVFNSPRARICLFLIFVSFRLAFFRFVSQWISRRLSNSQLLKRISSYFWFFFITDDRIQNVIEYKSEIDYRKSIIQKMESWNICIFKYLTHWTSWWIIKLKRKQLKKKKLCYCIRSTIILFLFMYHGRIFSNINGMTFYFIFKISIRDLTKKITNLDNVFFFPLRIW